MIGNKFLAKILCQSAYSNHTSVFLHEPTLIPRLHYSVTNINDVSEADLKSKRNLKSPKSKKLQ